MPRISIIGDPQDLTAVYLAWLARGRGFDVVELREDALGIDWTFEFDDIDPCAGALEIGGESHTFRDLHGAFVRLSAQPALPPGLSLAPLQHQTFVSERRLALHHFLECLPCVVANRPSAGRSNGSKPYQMRRLSEAGLYVPPWIVSNDAAVVQEFVRECPNGAIYKACSGLRSPVERVDDELFARLEQGTTPVVVQSYIPGRDVRVHTVKQQVFPTEVNAPGIDYRFASEAALYSATTVPAALAELCCDVAAREGLIVAGFDFRVTPDEHWYCLEVNPVPTFLPYEMGTGQPIAAAILDAFTARARADQPLAQTVEGVKARSTNDDEHASTRSLEPTPVTDNRSHGVRINKEQEHGD